MMHKAQYINMQIKELEELLQRKKKQQHCEPMQRVCNKHPQPSKKKEPFHIYQDCC